MPQNEPHVSDDQRPDPAPHIEQTASGHNVIQQVGSGVARIFDIDVNVSVLGGAVIGLPVLLLAAVVAIVFTRADPLEPLEGPGLKVAVAALVGDGDAGRQVASFVAGGLQNSLDQEQFTVAGPTRVREVPDGPDAAGRAAELLDAEVVIYGRVEPSRGGEGAVTVDLRVAIASQGISDSSPITLDGPFGAPFTVVPDDLGSAELATSAQTLVPFVGGVGALSADNFDRARSQFGLARDLAGDVPDDEFTALIETMRGYTELLSATVGRDVTLVDAAVDHFETALSLDPGADLAGVGLINVDYLRALDPDTSVVRDTDEMRDIIAAFDRFAVETDDPFARATASVQAAQARIAIDDPVELEVARRGLEALLAALPDLEQRQWGLFESFVQEKLGLVAFITGDTDGAIGHYEAAVVRASPYWSAFYLAAIGQIEISRGNDCVAADWFRDAAANVTGRFPDEANDYGRRAEQAEVDC